MSSFWIVNNSPWIILGSNKPQRLAMIPKSKVKSPSVPMTGYDKFILPSKILVSYKYSSIVGEEGTE